ncbi:hypothetical protein D3C81_1752980 [compost metagenome]
MVVDDQDGGLRIVERVDDFRCTPAEIDRVDHGISPRHRLVVLEKKWRIECKQCHAFAAGDTQAFQGTCQARDTNTELGIGGAASLIADGNGVGTTLQMTVQPLSDVHEQLQIAFYY